MREKIVNNTMNEFSDEPFLRDDDEDYGLFEVPGFNFVAEFSEHPTITKALRVYQVDGSHGRHLASLATISKCPRKIRKKYPTLSFDDKVEYLVDVLRLKMKFGFFDKWNNVTFPNEPIGIFQQFLGDLPIVVTAFKGDVPNGSSQSLELFGYYTVTIYKDNYYFYYGIRATREEAMRAAASFHFVPPR